MNTFTFHQGQQPLLISMPHVGEHIPASIAATMTDEAKQIADTDWHLKMLYEMAHQLGASVIAAKHSRYVIDLNRPVDNTNLYPGHNTTGLCPIDTFRHEPIYKNNQLPSDEEIEMRIDQYWKPYHMQLNQELQRIKDHHGIAILFDAHSIASEVPRFFSGKLQDFNLGTVDQTSCHHLFEKHLDDSMQSLIGNDFSYILNGRFKGGYITRHYGNPSQHIHAVQLEICQSLYMEEYAPFKYALDKAAEIQPILQTILNACIEWAKENAPQSALTK